MLTCLNAFFTSCIQGDLYELYEDDMEYQIPIKKLAKENVISEAQCGFCCMAHIKYGNVDNQSINKIVRFAQQLDISIEEPLSGSDIAEICSNNGIGTISSWVGVKYSVNGQIQVIRDSLIIKLVSASTPIIIQKEPNHWVVGTAINNNSHTVNYFDPKYSDNYGRNLSGTVGFDQIDCLIY